MEKYNWINFDYWVDKSRSFGLKSGDITWSLFCYLSGKGVNVYKAENPVVKFNYNEYELAQKTLKSNNIHEAFQEVYEFARTSNFFLLYFLELAYTLEEKELEDFDLIIAFKKIP